MLLSFLVVDCIYCLLLEFVLDLFVFRVDFL